MSAKPYAVPTALTHLWRAPSKALQKGDGVVVVWPDGARHYGTVAVAEERTAVIEHPGGTVRADIEWEGK